jgi:energy-coupling factor transporter ATP-binding protein EcfA2
MTRYLKNWDSEAIGKFIKQESQEKSREVFEKTHVPINRIRVEENKEFDTWTSEDEQFVDEDLVLDAVTDSLLNETNRLFFIVGESGCGKSELCQWLDYRIQDQIKADGENEFAHKPILIPRHVREPAEVLEILTEDIEGYDFENAKYLADIPTEAIFRKTTGGIISRFHKSQEEYTVEFLSSDKFDRKVKDNLKEYVENFDDPDESTTFEPIEQEELSEFLEEFPHVEHEHENHAISPVEYLYKEIKDGATEALKEMLFAGDIKEILRDIDNAYRERNRRPVLIIEDLAGFTIYDHQIISFFSDLSTAHFDVVIGVTTGPYRRLIDQRRADLASEDTINDRIRARLNLTEETGDGSKTLFLEQEDIHIDLARNYLRAIKEESDGSFEPPLPDGVTPADIDEAFGKWLYPFNEAFLTRIYENLQEDNLQKQTPRIYLNFVIEELLNNVNPPFEHADKLQQRLGVITNPISSEYSEPDEPVLKWYGVQSGDQYTVDTTIPAVFGIDSDGQAPILTGPQNRCPECGTQVYDTSGEWECPECGYSEGEEGELTKAEIFQELQNELLAWRRGETDFDKTSKIEAGAQRAIRYFYDAPNSLVRPECRSSEAAYLRWEKGGDKVPIHVDNRDEPQYTQIVLSTDVSEGVLTDLLRLGVWDETPVSSLDRHEDIELERLRDWADTAVSAHRAKLERDIEETFGASLDEMALFSKYLLNVFSGESTAFTPEALKTPINDSKIISSYATTDFEGNISRLQKHAELLIGLFHARFHIRKNIVDYDHLQAELDRLNPDMLRKRIAAIEGNLRGFKIGLKASDTMDFESFLRKTNRLNLRGYARDIREYEPTYTADLESIRSELTSVHEEIRGFEGGIELDDLGEAYNYINRASGSFQAYQELPQDQIDSTIERLSQTVDLLDSCESVWEFFVAYRMAGILKYHEPWTDSYEALSNLVGELEKLEEALDAKVRELEDQQFDPETNKFDSAQQTARELKTELNTLEKMIQ